MTFKRPYSAGLAALAVGLFAATAAYAEPTVNKGDNAWMLTSTVLVLLMTIPGLALFYGGLVRSKNMLSVLAQVFYTVCVVTVLWALYGYSLTFTGGSDFIGGFSKAFLMGVTTDSKAATFSVDANISELVYVCFQMTFAAITPALIVGAFAERMKFSAVALFIPLWVTLIYFPIAHMVWYWAGPDAIDFAGGTVVHINSGIAGLVGALIVGKRTGFGKELMPPHSLVMSMIGASLLWVGWLGFKAGTNLEAIGGAPLAMINSFLATAAAALSWMFAEWIVKGKPSLLGVISGCVAGLVAVTPASGFVDPRGALIIGIAAGVVCYWGTTGLKHALGYDDSLDVFGVHGVGGAVGAFLTGVLAVSWVGGDGKAGLIDGNPHQVITQLYGIAVVVVYDAIVSLILLKLVDLTIGLRVESDIEREGLDLAIHGEAVQ